MDGKMKIPKIPVNAILFAEAVEGLKANKMTRAQAAEHCGLAYGTFLKRLGYEGVAADVKRLASNGNKAIKMGSNNPSAKADPERHARYQAAIADVLAGAKYSDAARLHKVNYQVLYQAVKRRREQIAEKYATERAA